MYPFRLLLCSLFLAGVVYAQETPSVTVGTGRNELRIKFDPMQSIPRPEAQKLEQIGNYEVHELLKPEELAGRAAAEIDRINALPDGDDKNKQLTALATTLRNPNRNLLSATAPECRLECARIKVMLATPLDYDKTYVLTISGSVMIDGNPVKPVEFKLEKSATITEALNSKKTREELRIRGTGPINSPATLNISRKTLRINDEGTRAVDHIDNLAATASQPAGIPNLIEVTLAEKLNEAQSYTLLVPAGQITDGTGTAIETKGTITIPGLASPPDDPELSLAVETNAAVGQKPQFDFDLAWAPYKKYPWTRANWYWQPQVKVDVGLGDTKSDNAISLALLAHYSSIPSNLEPLPKEGEPTLKTGTGQIRPSDIQLRTLYRWRHTPWYRLGSYDFFIGPKLEADRAFNRINTLGNINFEFRFHRWVATIDEKRKLLAPQLHDLASLVEIDNGYRVIPYISFDFGGNVKNETVENTTTKTSISVPRHPIFRSNVGIKTLFQWRMFSFPMTLTLDERLMHLADHEDIAFVTDDGVGFRSMRGFHHRGEVAWNLALDPAKHYNFTITYENGRKAPNFEYLNKVSTGFKVIF